MCAPTNPEPGRATSARRRALGAVTLLVAAAACARVDWRPEGPPPAEVEGLARPEPVAFLPEDDLWPRVSPDGRYVAFVSQQNGNRDVWIRDFARRSTYPLTLDAVDDFDPDIAPSGDRLVFVSRRSDAKGDLYLASGFDTGASVERLTTDGSHDRAPAFSADGRKVYFTQAYGVGDEFVAELDLESKRTRRISPGPGFDPAPSPDGRYLVYSAPGLGPQAHPHLVALRLADSSTRAVTSSVSPAGFARFAPPPPGAPSGAVRVVHTRFPDDDDGSGRPDAEDRASLWRLDVDLEALFAGRGGVGRPFPLTDGAEDELFGVVQGGFLYFTQGSEQQDILRLPASGRFPEYADPAQYFELARTIQNPRTRWFALRCAWAGAAPGSELEAQSQLAIGRLQEERARPDLARPAYAAVLQGTRDAAPDTTRGELRGLAEVALAGLDRRRDMTAASGPQARAAVVRAAFARVSNLEARYVDSSAVIARAELERAEVLVDDGRRVEAAERLEQLVRRHPGEAETAARALLRRVDLLGVAYAPEAMGEAYRRVLARFPNAVAVVRAAAERIVDAHAGSLETNQDPAKEIDALRRLAERYGPGPVRTAARWRLVDRMDALGALDETAIELTRLVAEAGDDRLLAARALRRLARVQERRGQGALAVEAWRALRADYSDLPGFGGEARESITRVSLERARTLEQAGRTREAAAVYRRVIDNDVTQIEAHRRYFALSAREGDLEAAQDEAERRAERSPQTPVARYAHALGLTWHRPPKLDAALEEVEQAIGLNPQLVAAYVTRGWIREMQELRDPGFFSRAVDAVVQGFGRALGGLLDVEIGQQGLLEQALDDYKTALRLNPEAQDPSTEAEILLNLGNAHYRLAAQTNDLGNMRAAFERYLDALRLGLEHKDPRTALVFWERLGRAAGWVDELAVGVMATRRALEVAEQAGLRRRDPQLVGNLALLYALADEDAYAREALARLEAARADGQERSAWVVAVRDRARARLETVSARDRAQLDSVLRALAAGRGALDGIEEMDRGELPSLWLALGADGSRAQFGFDRTSELDLNISLAESAHDALGDRRRARALRDLRLGLTSRVIEDVPSVAFGFGDEHPTPLGVLRERLGLRLKRLHDRIDDGRLDEAQAELESASSELEGWLSSDRYSADHAALHVDRARLWVEAAELYVRREAHPPTARAGLDSGWQVAQDSLREAETLAGTATAAEALDLDFDALPPLPETLTSSGALTMTASAAFAAPRFAGVQHEARLMKARLAYARGLLAVWDAQHESAAVRGGPAALWGGLDGAIGHLDEAAVRFEAATLAAAETGAGRGLRVTVMALAAYARVQWARGRPAARVERIVTAAARLARAGGEGRLEWWARLQLARIGPPAALAKTVEALGEALPAEIGPSDGLVCDVYTRSASVALGAGDVAAAFGAIDRCLLFEGAAGPVVEVGSGRDRADSRAILRAYATAAAARRALGRLDARAPAERFEARRAASRVALESARATVRAARFSEAVAPRLLARARYPEEIEYDVEDGEGLLLPAPIDGALHLFFVDGSTTADSRLFHFVSDVPAAIARADLAALRAAAAEGRAPPAARRARLRRALFEPLRDRLGAQRSLLVASGRLGGALPLTLLEPGEPALTHLSAPSTLAAARSAQLVGVQGRRVIFGADGVALAPAADRLGPRDMLPFRAARGGVELEPGQSRSLLERTAVEALAERAQDVVVVEASFILEPSAPERSVIRFGGGAKVTDRFESELPLGQLDLPARLLVLARADGVAPGTPGWPRLDLPLVARGFATTVIVPRAAPPSAVRALVEKVLEAESRDGPAAAVRAAVGELIARAPQLALTTVVGAPGLDAQQTKKYAKARVRAARTRALSLLQQRAFEEAVPAFERWIRLQIEAGQTKYVVSAYRALVAILERRLSPPDFARAADVQEAFVAYLEGASAKETTRIDARIDLAFLYSRAQDYERAEALFGALIEELEGADRGPWLARAWYKYGLHRREALEYDSAAQALERAIAKWEGLGVYKAKKVPTDASRALREVGEVYLNRLSDPVRAGRAYQRARRYARGVTERIGVTLDLARVARRQGDFTAAAELATRAERDAEAAGEEELALSAVIEAANVAWYQGDHARGARLCTRSLEAADRLIAAQRARKGKSKLAGDRQLRRRKIYALSVCGLVAMSQRDREAALGHLQSALRIAQALDDLRETATQLNNLGRVHLEFGALRPAEDAFGRAQAIDERLRDRYSLAYDLRNLGWTLLQDERYEEAEAALETALLYSQQARDTNNELRARFALGELSRRQERWPEAVAAWQAALPLAERLDVKDLAWQIHWQLGNRAWAEGRRAEAEPALRRAVRIARSITGRAAPSALSPPRYAAFDDLARLLLETKRPDRAFEVVDEARRLEQLELLEDARLFEGQPRVPALLQAVREVRTATGAQAAMTELSALDPRVAALLRTPDPTDLLRTLPEGAAVLTFRVTERELLGFWMDREGLRVHRAAITRDALRALVGRYAAGMRARADLSEVSEALSRVLLRPFAARLAQTRRLGLVLHGSLRYLAFPALPFEGGALVDKVALIRALHPAAAVEGLGAPLGALGQQPITAFGGVAKGRRPLPFADRELTVIREEHPEARLVRGAAAGRDALLSALSGGPGVLHFAGHARLSSDAARDADPLGGTLETAAGDVTLLDVLRRRTDRDLVVLSGCSTRLGRSAGAPLDGADVLSMAETFHLAGAGHVLATTLRVEDLAAALVMKRFYRSARTEAAAEALRRAQIAVRKSYPHPAWWAGFSLSVGG